MADNNKINIDITTTANLAGIKSVESEIRNLEAEAASVQQKSIFTSEVSATQAKQAEEDLAEAIRRRAAAADKARLGETAANAAKSAANGDYLGAAKTIFENNAAKAIAVDAAVVLGSVTAAYVTMTSVFGGVKSQISDGTEATRKFREENLLLATTIDTLASPFATVGANIKSIWKSVSDSAINSFDKIFLGGALSSKKQAVEAEAAAIKMKASYEALVVARADQNARMLANDLAYLAKYQAAQNAVDAARLASEDRIATARDAAASAADNRAGLSDGAKAVNVLSRTITEDQRAEEIAKQALDVAYENQANAIAERSSAGADKIAAANAAVIASDQAVALAEQKLAEVQSVNRIQFEQKAADAIATNAADFESTATKIAEDLKTKLDTVQTQQGAETSAAVLQSLKGVNEVLADGTASAGEIGKLQAAIDAFRQSNEANSQVVQKGLADSSASLSKAAGILENHTAEITASRARLEALEQRVISLSNN